jgi:hypothetical protein
MSEWLMSAGGSVGSFTFTPAGNKNQVRLRRHNRKFGDHWRHPMTTLPFDVSRFVGLPISELATASDTFGLDFST